MVATGIYIYITTNAAVVPEPSIYYTIRIIAK